MDLQIPGYKPNDKSNSYLFEIVGLQGMRLPASFPIHEDMKLCAEFHLSFFYRNMKLEKQFFFGRTVKTSLIELRKDGTSEYGFRQDEPIFFHSTLGGKDTE